MKKLKFILSFLFVIVMTMSSVACGFREEYVNPGDDYEVNLDVDTNIQTTLKVGLYGMLDADKTHFENLEKAFNVFYPKVNIEIADLGAAETYFGTMMNLYQNNMMPDIIMVNSTNSFLAMSEKLLLNLDPYICAEKERNPQYEEQFVQSVWKLGQENFDGDQYFIPRSADRVVAHYNKKIFADAQVDMSLVHNGWTWDEFLKVCDTLSTYYKAKKPADKQAFVNPHFSWEAVMFPMLESLNGKVLNADGSVAIRSDATKDMLEKMRYLVDKGYMRPSNQGEEDITSQQTAIQFDSGASDLYIKYLKDDYNVVTFPLVGDSATAKIGAGVCGYGIFSGIAQEKRDIAWKFLNFTASKEGQNAMAEAGITTPPIRVDMQNPNTNKWGEGKVNVNLEAYTWQSERNFATSFFVGQEPEKQVDMLEALKLMVEDRLLNPNGKDSDTVMSECETKLKEIVGK